MKILHFTDSLRSGGKERQLVELLKGISSHDHIKCELATMSYEIHYPDVFKLGIKIHYLIRSKRKDLTIIPKLYTLCKEIKPDIIHAWGSFPSIFTVPVTKILNIKFINGTIRKAPIIVRPWSEDWIRSKVTFPFSDKIVANSLAGIKSYNAPLQKSICIYNGFDFGRINNLEKADSVRQRFKINTDKVVGMVATFSNMKDYKTYLLSAQEILKKRNDVTFVAVGGGADLAYYKKMILPQFRDSIKFLGKQSKVESIINIFDVGVLSTYSEGLSNSIMEYMALGKAVVATACDSNRELVINGENGFLVKQKDIHQMEQAITKLLNDHQLCLEMGKSSRERIHCFFPLNKMVEAYCDSYNELMIK